MTTYGALAIIKINGIIIRFVHTYELHYVVIIAFDIIVSATSATEPHGKGPCEASMRYATWLKYKRICAIIKENILTPK
eukprot:1678365-Amphidinium_carterae.1